MCTRSGARLPSWVNSLGKPSRAACQSYASFRRPWASAGGMMLIQGMGRASSSGCGQNRFRGGADASAVGEVGDVGHVVEGVFMGLEREHLGTGAQTGVAQTGDDVRAVADDGEMLEHGVG